MTAWKCPNKPQKPDHPETILFDDAPNSRRMSIAYMQVPKPAYCEFCKLHYTKDECVVIES